MSLGEFFKPASGIRRTPLFRFSLMVIRPDNDPTLRRTSTTWSALKGEPIIALAPGQLVQQFDKHLARMGMAFHPCGAFNYLEHTNRHGGSRGRCRHHSLFRAARLPQSQSVPKSPDQPSRKPGLLLDPRLQTLS